jgi:hypothetical protein
MSHRLGGSSGPASSVIFVIRQSMSFTVAVGNAGKALIASGTSTPGARLQ